jgi:predicted amidohydrolase YtcJ
MFILFFLLALASSAADLIVLNANVLTIDSSKPAAQAFAVTAGRFTAVGTNAEIRKLATPGVKIIDLQGKTVTPGFNDTHVHPAPRYPEDSPYYIPWIGPDKAPTIDALIAILKRKAAITPPGQLVFAGGYDDVKLGRHPNRSDLDQVSTQHPILVTHSSGHVSGVNSYVLDQAGINRDTKDPSGGSLDRDSSGLPNGVVRESARSLLTIRRPGPGDNVTNAPWEEQVRAYRRGFQEYAARGITSANVAGAGPDNIRLYQAVRDLGNPIRLGVMISQSSFQLASGLGLKSGFGDDNLRFTAMKTFQGNSMSGRTCWLSEEYSDRPGYFGIPPARSQEELDKDIQAMHDAGWQIAVHSNGDREIDMVITSIERAQAKTPRPNARHRIEHASVMTQPLLERAKRAGIILVFHSYMWEHGNKLVSYGPKRLAMVHPYRTALDMGVLVAGHSDSQVSAADPLLRIQDMVTRQTSDGRSIGPNQRVSVDEAIRVWTLDGAYTTFEESSKGSITPGKLADFVVLRADPRKVPVLQIKDIVIEATYVGGKAVFTAPPGKQALIPRTPIFQFGDGDEDSNHHIY